MEVDARQQKRERKKRGKKRRETQKTKRKLVVFARHMQVASKRTDSDLTQPELASLVLFFSLFSSATSRCISALSSESAGYTYFGGTGYLAP